MGPQKARTFGVRIGVLPPGPLNALTDVPGVRVGHVTLVEGSSVRTGVTAVLPHAGNLHAERVPGAIAIGNGYGKLTGYTQVRELGELETPIVLTNTLAVGAAAEGVVRWTLGQPGNESVCSVNAVVGETNDGLLNDIRALAVCPEHVVTAIRTSVEGPVPEGAVGAGTGTQAFGWKGGVGTSSRRVRTSAGAFTVGVLVQTNFGGILSIAGVPIGSLLAADHLSEELLLDNADGSVVFVIATDAPLGDRNLERLAKRAFLGLGRTGSPMTNGSGDYAIAFSTHPGLRRQRHARGLEHSSQLANDHVSPLFLGAVEAAEEAVCNAMFQATTTSGHRGRLEALPRERVIDLLRQHRALADE